ncbi:MAG TPA: PAS domain-containing sensor histidine kinase [bacterium]|nr:PAS domain-containing sensor histidine kinase [bacterium]
MPAAIAQLNLGALLHANGTLFDVRSLIAMLAVIQLVFLLFIVFIPARFDYNCMMREIRRMVLFGLLGITGYLIKGAGWTLLDTFLANLALYGSYTHAGRAARRFRGLPLTTRLDLLLVVVFALPLFYFTLISPDYRIRTLGNTTLQFILIVRLSAVLLLPSDRPYPRQLVRFICGLLLLDVGGRLFISTPFVILTQPANGIITQADPLTQLWVLYSGSIYPIMSLGMIWLLFDRLTRQLGESEAFLREVTEHAPGLLFAARQAAGGRHEIIWTNRDPGALFAPDPEPAGEHHALTAFHPDDRARAAALFAQSSGERHPLTLDVRLRMRDGNYRWHHLAASMHTGGNGQPTWYGSLTDIDRLYTASEQLRAASEVLTAQNRELHNLVDYKTRLMAIIAHDLRNPFAVIMMAADHFSNSLDILPPDKQRKLGAALLMAATRVHTLLENLMAWSRRHDLPYKPVRLILAPFCRKAAGYAVPSAQTKNIALTYAVGPQLCVTADQRMLEAILRNLIGNAVKYTPEGGHVSVTATPQGERITLAVTDTGGGIDPQLLILLPEADTLPSIPGTAGEQGSGLGLVIARDFAARHGSRLIFTGTPDGGTCCTVTLPA